jgi:hypothetical protein
LREDPVILFCSPRGGSSVVAGVFVTHGWWVGETYTGISRYKCHENVAIKKFCKKHYKLDAGVPEPNPQKANLRRMISREVPEDADWMFKGPAEYYPIFQHWFPRMNAVMIFREFTQAVEGAVRVNGEAARAGAERIIRARYDYMEELLKQPRTWRVDADDVVRGDLSQIERVMNWYNVDLDYQQGISLIDPKKFHT